MGWRCERPSGEPLPAMRRKRDALARQRRRLVRWAGTPLAVRLAAAYLVILVPTLIAKSTYWPGVRFGGIGGAVRPLITAGGALPGWLYAVLLFTRDFLEVALVVAVVLVPGHFLRRSLADGLAFALVGSALLAMAVNHLCFQQLGTLLTLDTLQISAQWIHDDPGTIRPFLTRRRIVMLPAILALALVPVIAARRAPRAARPGVAASPLTAVAAGGVTIAALLHGMLVASPGAIPPQAQGYWTRALLTFLALDERDLRTVPVPSKQDLASAYRRLVFRPSPPPPASYVVDLPTTARRPRHVLILSLETAPQKYYSLTAPSGLPVFDEMGRRAIVSDRHYSTAPYTTRALYSVLTGVYPRQGPLLSRHGELRTDNLGTVLTRHGYETTYIDSWLMSGWATHRRMLSSLGFATLLEAPLESWSLRYGNALQNEERAFQRALDAITGAAGRGGKALVCVSTSFGHFPWKVKPGDEALSGREKLRAIARLFDGLMGRFLVELGKHGLGEDVIVVVTGDHGLRFGAEFESLGEEMQHGDLTFNVPLLIYAPALFPAQVRLDHVSSHVDIAPTLLDLLGVAGDGLFHHGDNLLDRRLEARITFLMSAGLHAVEGFHWRDRFFLQNQLTGQVTVRGASDGSGPPQTDSRALTDREVANILRDAAEIFEVTAAHFLQRATGSSRAVTLQH